MEIKFLNDLLTYLITYHRVRENTAMKYVQCIKEIIEPVYNMIRDIAVFQCFTGYAYNETWDAQPKNIFDGFDGQLWISKDRQKTGTEEAAPLLPIALKIIEKYRNHPQFLRTGRLLPVPTNEYYNRCLKEMGKKWGLQILITHIGFGTFLQMKSLIIWVCH